MPPKVSGKEPSPPPVAAKGKTSGPSARTVGAVPSSPVCANCRVLTAANAELKKRLEEIRVAAAPMTVVKTPATQPVQVVRTTAVGAIPSLQPPPAPPIPVPPRAEVPDSAKAELDKLNRKTAKLNADLAALRAENERIRNDSAAAHATLTVRCDKRGQKIGVLRTQLRELNAALTAERERHDKFVVDQEERYTRETNKLMGTVDQLRGDLDDKIAKLRLLGSDVDRLQAVAREKHIAGDPQTVLREHASRVADHLGAAAAQEIVKERAKWKEMYDQWMREMEAKLSLCMAANERLRARLREVLGPDAPLP
eukprot:gnl/Spiro4/23095_TR11419_c0_g1_i1.p2 gnl/Spiro4/23095_TR11419_c0_g1~~gnl/Spiro4/23095_TR11419_c0_g1_i1.p2  ORF type:complete len:311 (+),score=94.44 gnl/Spiro4/23095_TR11419_c0_g1_i1:89-1021(+)